MPRIRLIKALINVLKTRPVPLKNKVQEMNFNETIVLVPINNQYLLFAGMLRKHIGNFSGNSDFLKKI